MFVESKLWNYLYNAEFFIVNIEGYRLYIIIYTSTL